MRRPISIIAERSVTMTHPMGGWTVFHFSTTVVRPTGGTWGGWEYGLPFKPSVPDETGQYVLSQEIFDAAGSKLRSIYVAYERDRIPPDHGGCRSTGTHESPSRAGKDRV
jgi:hypothetical protein